MATKVKHIVVSDKAVPKGHPCPICKKAARPGDAVVYITAETEDYCERIAIHARCMLGLLDQEPALLKPDLEAKKAVEAILEAQRIKLAIEELRKEYVDKGILART